MWQIIGGPFHGPPMICSCLFPGIKAVFLRYKPKIILKRNKQLLKTYKYKGKYFRVRKVYSRTLLLYPFEKGGTSSDQEKMKLGKVISYSLCVEV